MRKHLAWVAVVALVAALAGQYVVYRSAVPVATGHASWNFAPKNFADVTTKAKDVVEASVVSVEAGPPIVTAQKGEPSGTDVIPTQRITMKVTKVHKGKHQPGDQIIVFRTGGSANVPSGPAQPAGTASDPKRGTTHQDPPPGGKPNDPNSAAPNQQAPQVSSDTPPSATGAHVLLLADDPAYSPGENYFLALEDRVGGTLGPVSPAGRYRIGADNKLQAISNDPVSQGVNGHDVADAAAAARGEKDIPNGNGLQGAQGGPPAAFRSNVSVKLLTMKGIGGVTGSTIVVYNSKTKMTTVTLSMKHLKPMTAHPAHIHQGVCGSNGKFLYPFPTIHADAKGMGSTTTVVKGSFLGKKLFINVHTGPGLSDAMQYKPIACVNLR